MTNIDPRLNDIAQKIDKSNVGNKNSKILDTNEERQEFLKKAREAKIADEEIQAYFSSNGVQNDDINEIFNSKFETKQMFSGKSIPKDIQKHFFAYLNNPDTIANFVNARDLDWNSLIRSIQEDVQQAQKEPGTDNYYNTMLQVFQNVGQEMQKLNFNDRKSVEALYDKVKNALGGTDDFTEDIIEKFVEYAEARQVRLENNNIRIQYRHLIDDEGLSREEAIDSIQKNDSFKGSYFHDYKHGLKMYTGLIHKFEDEFVMDEASKSVDKYIEEQRGANHETSRDLENAIKKQHPNLDKYERKVMRGRWELSASQKVGFESSTYKAKRKEVVISDRAERIKQEGVTKEDLTKRSSSAPLFRTTALKHDEVFNMLIAKHLIEPMKNADGELNGRYDVTKLSDLIASRGGGEKVVNNQKRQYIPYSEVNNILVDILSKQDNNNVKLTKHDVIALARQCGYEYDGKNFWKILYNGTIGSLADMAVGFASMLATGVKASVVGEPTAQYVGSRGPWNVEFNFNYEKDIPFRIDSEDISNLTLHISSTGGALNVDEMALLDSLFLQSGLSADNVALDTLEDGSLVLNINYSEIIAKDVIIKIQEELQQKFSLTPEELGIDFSKIDIDKSKLDAEAKKELTKAILTTVLLSLALGILREALNNKGELPIVTQYVQDGMDIDEFERSIRNRKELSKKQQDGIIALAEVFRGQDDWTRKFTNVMEKIAGPNSMLNRLEFAVGISKAINENTKQPSKVDTVPTTPVEEPKPKEEAKQEEEGTKFKIERPGTDFDGNVDVIKNAGKYGWENLGRMYEGDPFKGSNAFRAMEVIQAIDPNHDDVKGKYNVDKINDIVNKAFPRGNGKPDWNYINNNLAKEYPMVDVQRLKKVLSSQVSADETADKKVVAPKVLYDNNNVEYKRGDPNAAAPVKQRGKDNGNRFGVTTGYSQHTDGSTDYYFRKQNIDEKVTKDEYDSSNRREINPNS